jgi:hypothetical protein
MKPALGKDPATETSYWRRVLFPAVLAQYVQLGTYGDCLLESDTSDERDPVMLQIRGQNASRARSDAEDEINRQINRLQAQGQNYSYLPFGVVVRRSMHGLGVCTVPGYVLQGGGAYNYGPIAPTGSGTTTLTDQCETAWGYIPPAPPVVTVQVPIANQRGMVQLVLGQGYVDVVFHSTQTNSNWILVECEIVNTTDSTPLNIAPGIITSRTLTGFRIQLEGLPDTSNYFLRWAINGNIVPPAPATTYALSGPSSGRIGAAATFTVELLADTTVTDPVTVTPSDGGGGGTFSPTSVELTTTEASATFIYTPGLYGAKTIATANDGGLTDPAALSFTSVASTYTLAGPSSGAPSVPSTNFTVALPAGGVVLATVTVTPHDGGSGGTFTPTTVGLTTAAPSATFTYTPASVGTKTISVTNNGGLTDPGNLTYTAAFVQHLLNTLISYWKLDEASGPRNDSQGSNHLTVSNAPVGVSGKINNGMQLIPASSQNAFIVSNSTLQVTGSFTFSVWVKLSSQSTFAIVEKGAGPTSDYRLSYFTPSTGFFFGVHITGGSVATDYAIQGSTVANGVWTHLVVWYDAVGGQVQIRVNDAATSNSTTSPALIAGTDPFVLGSTGANTSFLDGVIDEVGFWKRLLTPGEITALYNGGAGLPYSSFLA